MRAARSSRDARHAWDRLGGTQNRQERQRALFRLAPACSSRLRLLALSGVHESGSQECPSPWVRTDEREEVRRRADRPRDGERPHGRRLRRYEKHQRVAGRFGPELRAGRYVRDAARGRVRRHWLRRRRRHPVRLGLHGRQLRGPRATRDPRPSPARSTTRRASAPCTTSPSTSPRPRSPSRFLPERRAAAPACIRTPSPPAPSRTPRDSS